MKHETILKRLEDIVRARNGREAKEKLIRLIEELRAYVERMEERKEKYGRAIRHLMGWYTKLWDGRPPESFGYAKWQDRVGKTLRELIAIYEQNGQGIEELKKDYEEFRSLKESWLKGDGSILRFKTVLPNLKQTKNSKWVSPGNARGIDKYLWEEDNDELSF